ncbi:transposase [Phaeobacter inhibens]|nr:transposase [Phaeobacter inhibens]
MHNDVVSAVSYVEGVMRGELLGVERRRRWSDDDKLAIVSSVGIDEATVTQIAHRHDVTRQKIYRQRHELKKKGLWPTGEGAVFLPIDFHIAEAVTPPPEPTPPSAVELRLSNGRCLRFDTPWTPPR